MDIEKEVKILIDKKLVSESQVKRLLALDYFTDAYEVIKSYTKDMTDNYELNREIINKLFIYYLSHQDLEKKNQHYFEEVLGKMCGYLDDEALEYLLNQKLDMEYIAYDAYGAYESLDTLLALYIKSPKGMNMFLDKIKDSDKKCFYHAHYEIYTDLCIMNIVAGNLITALDKFNEEDYFMFMGIKDEFEMQKTLSCDNEVYIDEFNGNDYDNLYKILKTIKCYCSTYGRDARILLTGILYSKNIKLFNVENLPMIKEMLDDDAYNKFVSYLSYMVNQGDITLFSIGDDKNIMKYEAPENTFRKDSTKTLKRVIANDDSNK